VVAACLSDPREAERARTRLAVLTFDEDVRARQQIQRAPEEGLRAR
jgi:hypothetical protein